MSLLKKILFPAMSGLFILGSFCTFFTLEAFQEQGEQELSTLRTNMMSEKTEKIKSIVEIAHHILLSAHNNQELNIEQRKLSALSLIKELRYSNSNYLWINDMQPTMIMHPIKPALDGKSLASFQDPEGKKLFVKMVEVCKRQSEGTVGYLWPKPGHDKPVPKLSYVKLFAPWNWVIGTGIYIDDIDAAVAEKKSGINLALKRQRNRLILITVLILGITCTALTMIARTIVRPINKAVHFAQDMATGDLSHQLDVHQKDEIGILARALNQMGASLSHMFKDIANGMNTISSSSTELSAISEQMTQSANQTSSRATSVAAASEKMSSNMSSVATASEHASTNVSMVASAAEEMTATVKEIAQNSATASSITAEAVAQAKSASDKVNQLGTAASEISKVTEVITEISEQTNLLALNATIEAARAGEAGKGFAVVANEIKELAKQTAAATQEIKTKIGGVQDSTTLTVAEIKQISKVINEVNDIVATIATAVEEQAVATQEIAGNVTQASQGIGEVHDSVAQSSSVSGAIAKDIAQVNLAGQEVSGGSEQLNISAQQLSQLAEQINEKVAGFNF